jgi:nucleotide-binding universal stress UspA family protein
LSGGPARAGPHPGVRSRVDVAYQHILVAYDGTPAGDSALRAASKLATRDGARLTIVTVVTLERPIRRVTRLPMLTSLWNDVLLDRTRADLERADRLLDVPAERTVLFGPLTKALAAGAEEFGCDAIILPARQPRWLAKLLRYDRARRLQRRAGVPVLRPR